MCSIHCESVLTWWVCFVRKLCIKVASCGLSNEGKESTTQLASSQRILAIIICRYKVLGFHSGHYEDYRLQECDAVQGDATMLERRAAPNGGNRYLLNVGLSPWSHIPDELILDNANSCSVAAFSICNVILHVKPGFEFRPIPSLAVTSLTQPLHLIILSRVKWL
jgi:hypothetical protein